MSGPEAVALDGLIARLQAAASRLREDDLDANAAASLVEDCAATATQASAELERLSRTAGGGHA